MAIQLRSTLKNWFKHGLKPLETQFGDWIDSYWHKTEDAIPIASISTLQTVLNGLATTAALSAVIDGAPTAGNTLNKLYNLITSIGQFAGSYSASGGGVPTGGTGSGGAIIKGDYWIVNVGGTVSGLGVLKPGDVVWAKVAGANTASQFFAVETNEDLATPTVMGLVKLVQSISGSGASDETLSTAGIYSALASLNRNLSQVLTVGNDAGAQQIKNLTDPTSAQDADTKAARDAAIATAIANLINSAPGALDTLKELADALGDDPNFASTITAALALKAPLASPALTGTPTAPTASGGTNTAQIATTAFVKAALDALINAAPSTLDTLKELADALGDDANFASTVTTALAAKEALANKATDFSILDNTKYPTTQAVETEIYINTYFSQTPTF